MGCGVDAGTGTGRVTVARQPVDRTKLPDLVSKTGCPGTLEFQINSKRSFFSVRASHIMHGVRLFI